MNKILNIFFLILSINTNIYASKPQTHFDLRNIMKDASFSYYEGDKVLATFNGKYKDNNVVDKYDKISFFINNQYTFSKLNFKLNNNLQVNEYEIKITLMMDDIKINNKERGIWMQKQYPENIIMIKQYASEPYKIPYSLYYDVLEILKNNKVIRIEDQLKLDIYRQIQDMEKYKTQYDNEFKVLQMYFINQFYKKIAIGYAYTNDYKEKKLECVVP